MLISKHENEALYYYIFKGEKKDVDDLIFSDAELPVSDKQKLEEFQGLTPWGFFAHLYSVRPVSLSDSSDILSARRTTVLV